MTTATLSFLKEATAESIGEYNEDTDSGSTQHNSLFHVDDCRFRETFARLNRDYEALVESLDPDAPNVNEARQTFGRILHTTQDFYAHSNWVEGVANALVSVDEFRWPAGSPGSVLGGMVVLGIPMPSGFIIAEGSDARLPLAWDGERWRDGLMTGEYPANEGSSICPSFVALPHGDFFTALDDYDTYLSKDAPRSYYHEEAIAFAKRQTQEEFCRVARLVLLRHGEPGLEFLLSQWVSDRPAFWAKCANTRSLVTGLLITLL